MPITPGMSRLFVLLVTALLFAAAHAAERSLWVDAKHGRDSARNQGAPAAHGRRRMAARAPGRRTAHGHRIRLRAGRYRQAVMPTYWEQRRGSVEHPITLESADAPGRAVVPPLNVFR